MIPVVAATGAAIGLATVPALTAQAVALALARKHEQPVPAEAAAQAARASPRLT